jgi:hypothetical protein
MAIARRPNAPASHAITGSPTSFPRTRVLRSTSSTTIPALRRSIWRLMAPAMSGEPMPVLKMTGAHAYGLGAPGASW